MFSHFSMYPTNYIFMKFNKFDERNYRKTSTGETQRWVQNAKRSVFSYWFILWLHLFLISIKVGGTCTWECEATSVKLEGNLYCIVQKWTKRKIKAHKIGKLEALSHNTFPKRKKSATFDLLFKSFFNTLLMQIKLQQIGKICIVSFLLRT